jgi:transposase
MGKHLDHLDRRLAVLDAKLTDAHANTLISQMLAKIPGVGPGIAITMALGIEAQNLASGRHFAAWLGLTPKEHSTGGKQRMGRISKAGNARLRTLLVVGATAVIRFAKPGSRSASAGLLKLLDRKPRKVAAVALANTPFTHAGMCCRAVDGPDHLGHDGARGGLSARAGDRRLIRAPVSRV